MQMVAMKMRLMACQVYVRSVINAKRPYLDGTLEDPTGQWTVRSQIRAILPSESFFRAVHRVYSILQVSYGA